MIITTTPANVRRPGAYPEFKFLAAGQQLVPLPLRVAIVAESKGGTLTLGVPIQVFDEDDADTKCGKGSFAALMARMALATMKIKGSGPEIWVCGVAESGGLATQNTLTVVVTTAVAGNVVLQIGGKTITVGVSAADPQNTIATAIKNALDTNKAILPFTAAVAANVVTTTNVTKGVNGNDCAFTVLSQPVGVTVTAAQSVAGTLAADPTAAINALYDQRYHAVVLSNHTTVDVATAITARLDAWSYNQKNYRFFFMGERGSLGTAQTLQASANDFGIVVVSCEQIPGLPQEMAVGVAVAEFAREAPNANLDGDEIPMAPPNGSFAYTTAEIESGLNSGVTVLTPSITGARVRIERLVTTQTTLNSAPFEPLRDLAYPRTAAFRAEQLDIGFRTGFIQESLTPEVLQRVRDMIIAKDRAMEAAGYLTGVDDLIDQIQVEKASTPAGRVVASAPFQVAGPLHQGVFVNTMYFS